MTDAGFGLGWAVVRRVPEAVAARAFAVAADRVWRRRGAAVRQLEANLRRARPGLSEAELRSLSRAGMASYARYWCETFRLPAWSRERVVASVVVEDEQYLRRAYASGHGVVVALPHLANWDHAGAWACLTGMPLTTVAERLRPQRLFDRFVGYRERLGMEVVPATGGRDVVALLADRLRSGRLVCLVADRDLSAGGVPVPLCGALARLPAGPALLARTTGAALLPATMAYAGPLLRIRIHPPVAVDPGREGLVAATRSVADAFTAGIVAAPQDWHMLQRVFLADLPAGRATR